MAGRSHSSEVARVRQTLRASLLVHGVRAGDAIVIACSHGPDSLALADGVLALRRPLGLGPVTLCYVDHGLRADARDEAARVRAFAAANDADAEVRRVHVDRGRGGGPEEAARAARYAALAEVADERGAAWILVGHTASDQAETVLLRLLRGAGPLGLAGIPAQRGRVLRPLLGLARADVLAYLAARDLSPSEDESNAAPDFLRNRVRAGLLPALRVENPSIDAGLARTARAMREVADALEWAAGHAESLADTRRTPQGASVAVAALTALPAAIAKRLLLRLAGELGACLHATHLESALALCAGAVSAPRTLSAPGLRLTRSDGRLELARRLRHQTVGIRVLVDVESAERLRVRIYRPGDRMRPERLQGRSRKLSDLYADAHVPRADRAHAIVAERRDGSILWAEHVGPAFGAKVRVSLTRLDPGVNTETLEAKGDTK